MWNEQPKVKTNQRIESMVWIFVGMLLFLLIRLWFLSVLETSLYQQKSELNRMRVTPLLAPRGNIYDRYGEILAQDVPRYAVSFLPGDVSIQESREKLESVLGRHIDDRPQERLSGEVLLANSITLEEVSRIEEANRKLPGIMVETQPTRVYPAGVSASHVIGYIGRISEMELMNLAKNGYAGEDMVGKSGVELYYEDILRGEKGFRRVEVDALGKIVRLLDYHPPRFHNSLALTLDREFQEFCYSLLEGKSGVIIAGDPRNGEILAMASRPAFNPNALVKGMTQEEWQRMVDDSLHSFTSRSVQALYPPGSVFKPVLALAALEEGIVTADTRTFCPGFFDYGNQRFYCWRRSGHGSMNLVDAIAHSCNVTFYNLGLKLGPEGISRWAQTFRMGESPGIDLTDVNSALLPDPRWKRQHIGEPWYPGDTINYSIGQGFVLLTPFDVYRMISIIAARGRVYQPQLMSQVLDNRGEVVRNRNPVVEAQLPVADSSWNVIIEGMKRAVRQGTGTACRGLPVEIAAKTGTAQNPHGEEHSWFGGFFPADAPSVAFVVMIEHGGGGSGIAAQTARTMIEWYVEHRGGAS